MITRTLGDLRGELSDRLGFASQTITPDTVRVLNSFLREAHDILTMMYEWPSMERDWVFQLVVGQTMYSLPLDACGYTPDEGRMCLVYIQYDTLWMPMYQGIEPWRYTLSQNMVPRRWEINHNTVPDQPALTYTP